MPYILRYLIDPIDKEKYLDVDFKIDLDETTDYELDFQNWHYIKCEYVKYSYDLSELYSCLDPNKKPYKIERWTNYFDLTKSEEMPCRDLIKLSLLQSPYEKIGKPRAKKQITRHNRIHILIPIEMIQKYYIPRGKKLYDLFKRGMELPFLVECPYLQRYDYVYLKDMTIGITDEDKVQLEDLISKGEIKSKLILQLVYNGLLN